MADRFRENSSIRPFTKIIEIGSTLTSAITFTDSTGTLLECNYIHVHSAGNVVTAGYIIVYPSGIYEDPTVLPTSTTSGAGGVVARIGEGITIVTDWTDPVSAIRITNVLGVQTVFMVNYGVLRTEQNHLKARYTKPKGS